jgi:hypothetical protein
MMKTSANCDNNRSVMKIDIPLSGRALDEQYGEGYFSRVYRTSLIVFAVAAALVSGRGGWPALIGLSYGTAISLGGLRAIEIVVRGLFRPGVRLNPKWVTALMVLKLPLLSVVLAGAAWLAVHHLANPFALVGGLALVQAVIFLKAVGSLLVSALPAPAVTVSPAWMRAEPWLNAAARARMRPTGAAYPASSGPGAAGAPRGYAAVRPEPLPAPE